MNIKEWNRMYSKYRGDSFIGSMLVRNFTIKDGSLILKSVLL